MDTTTLELYAFIRGANLLNEIHNPNSEYKQGDVVDSGDLYDTRYLALQPIPANKKISLSNLEYWVLFSASPRPKVYTPEEIKEIWERVEAEAANEFKVFAERFMSVLESGHR